MKTQIALALLGALALPSCTETDVSTAARAVPAIDEAGVAASGSRARRSNAATGLSGPVTPVSFRTPDVTNSLVEEKDLLPGSNRMPAPDKGPSGSVIARPPASGDSE